MKAVEMKQKKKPQRISSVISMILLHLHTVSLAHVLHGR